MNILEAKLRRAARIGALAMPLLVLGACVYQPVPVAYQPPPVAYQPAPVAAVPAPAYGYYDPGYAYGYYPPVVGSVGLGVGYWGGWRGGGWGWRR